MRRTTLAAFAAALCAVVYPSRPAHAAAYAAMNEVPVKSGELRLQRAVAVRVDGPHGPEPEEEIAFPLKHTRVDVGIQGPLAQVTVEQTFENPFDEPLEALYLFPLGAEAAVNEYEITVGERTIRGEVKTREQARETYERAKNNGQTAALLEQQKENVFSQSVANIPPRQAVKVRFAYVEMLTHRDGNYEWVFPMVVGPRYLPTSTNDRHPVGARPAGSGAPGGLASIPYLPPGMRSGHDIEVNVRLDAAVPLHQLASPSHRIVETREGETGARVSLAPDDTVPNRDFILRYSGAGEATVVGALADRHDKDGYFSLLIQPKAEYRTQDVAPRELVAVIDRSCSMSGEPLEQAKALTHALVETLTDRDTFNVMAFSDGLDELAPQPIRADAAAKARAQAWVKALSAGGGTELGPSVAHALLRKPGEDRLRMIYLLTDGFVGNDDDIVVAVQKTGGFNRVFPIGVSNAPNRSLLDRLGQVGRGFSSYVTLKEPVQAVADDLVRRTSQPYLTDVEIDWGGLEVKDLTPQRLPDVYAGLPLVVSGRYGRPGKATVRVQATVAGRRVSTPLELTLPEHEERPAVAALWARQRIHELDLTQCEGEKSEVKKAITELGLGFHLVTAYTSFVAVDERQVAAPGGRTRTVVQPVEMPEGVSFDGVFGPGADGSSGSNGSTGNGPDFHYTGGSSGGGGGGDVDPFTLVTIASLLPLAWAVRKRRAQRALETRA